MPTTLAEATRNDAPPIPQWLRWVVGAVAVCVATVAFTNLVRGPQFVPSLTVVNPSPYALDVRVADAHHDGWMLLGTIDAKSRLSLSQVVDQGGTWMFNVSGQAVNGGDITVTRSALAASGWRLTISQAVIDRVAAAEAVSASATSS